MYLIADIASFPVFNECTEEIQHDEINKLLSEAGYDERESNRKAQHFEQTSPDRPIASSEGSQARTGSETTGTSTIQSAPQQASTDQGIRDQVTAIVKRRAAANELGKGKQFDAALQHANDFMNGKEVSPLKLKKAALQFSKDKPLFEAFNNLNEHARPQTKQERTDKFNLIESYKSRIEAATKEDE